MGRTRLHPSANSIVQCNQLTLLTSKPNPIPFIIPLPEDSSTNVLKLCKNVSTYVSSKILIGDRVLEKLVYNENLEVDDQVKITGKNAKKIAEYLGLELEVNKNFYADEESFNDLPLDGIGSSDGYKPEKLSPSYLFTSIYDDFAVNYKLISKSAKLENLWQLFFNFSDKLPASRNQKIICVSESNTEASILADYEKMKKVVNATSGTEEASQTADRKFYKVLHQDQSRSNPQVLAILSSENDKTAAMEEFDEFFDGLYKIEKFTPGERPKLRPSLKGSSLTENLGDIDKNLIYIGILMAILAFCFAKLMYT